MRFTASWYSLSFRIMSLSNFDDPVIAAHPDGMYGTLRETRVHFHSDRRCPISQMRIKLDAILVPHGQLHFLKSAIGLPAGGIPCPDFVAVFPAPHQPAADKPAALTDKISINVIRMFLILGKRSIDKDFRNSTPKKRSTNRARFHQMRRHGLSQAGYRCVSAGPLTRTDWESSSRVSKLPGC